MSNKKTKDKKEKKELLPAQKNVMIIIGSIMAFLVVLGIILSSLTYCDVI